MAICTRKIEYSRMGLSNFQLGSLFCLFILYSLLFIFVIGYFTLIYIRTIKKINIKEKINIIEKLKIFTNEIEKQRFDNIISLLRQYNFRTKNDIKLAIDYYNSGKPIKVESDYLGWIVSIAITLSSFIEIAYNEETKSIDTTKISVILSSTRHYNWIFNTYNHL